jgi:hypothetical protein
MATSRYQPKWTPPVCKRQLCHRPASWWDPARGREGPLCAPHASIVAASRVLVPIEAHYPTEGWMVARELAS